jgi:plasmid stabilization system protein ParE
VKVVFTAEADRDLEEAVSYLLERNPVAAARLVERAFDLARALAEGVFDGPWMTLSDGRRVKSWPLPPYRLFYRRTADVLLVLRFYDQRQRPL